MFGNFAPTILKQKKNIIIWKKTKTKAHQAAKMSMVRLSAHFREQ